MQLLAVAGLVASILGFGIALLFARRESRVSDLFSAARIATALIAIAVLSILTGISTPTWMIVVAVVAGLVVGVVEGRNLEVRVSGDTVLSRRTWVGVAVFAAGLVLIQAASIADSYRLVEIGLAVTWFSAALTLGMVFGRRRPIAESRRRVTVDAGTTMLLGWIVAGAAVMTLVAIPTATAQAPNVLDMIADGTYEAAFSNFEFRSSITVVSSSGTMTKNDDTITWSWSIQWEQALVDCAYQNRDSWSGSEIVLVDPTFVNVMGDRVFEVDLTSTCGTPSGDVPSNFPTQLRLDLVGSELQGSIGVGQISFPVVLVDAQAGDPAPSVDEEEAVTEDTASDDTTTTIEDIDADIEPVATSESEEDVEEVAAQDGIDDADPVDDDESVSPGEAAAAGMAAVGLAAATAAISMAGVQSPTTEDPPTDPPTVEDDTTVEPPSDDTAADASPATEAEEAAAAAAAAAGEASMEEMRQRAAEREAWQREDEARQEAQARADQALRDGTSGVNVARAAGALALAAEIQAIPAPLREVLGAAASPHSGDIAEALIRMNPGQGTRVLDGVADVLRASHPAGTALTATINNGERLVAWAEMRRAGVGVMSDMVGKGLGAIGLLFDIERGLRQGSRIAELISPQEIIGETPDGNAIVSQPGAAQVVAGTVIGGAHVAAHFVATKNPLVLIPDMVINYASGGLVSIDAALTVVEDGTLSGIVWVSEGLGANFAQWWDQ